MASYSEALRFLAIRVWIPVTGYYRGRVLRDETPQQTESVAPLPTISNPAAAVALPVLISYEWRRSARRERMKHLWLSKPMLSQHETRIECMIFKDLSKT